jgi:hypothetical protein
MTSTSLRSKERQKNREESEEKKEKTEEKPKSAASTHDEVRLSCRKLLAGALTGNFFQP